MPQAFQTDRRSLGSSALMFAAALGMTVSALWTVQHFFAANYPKTIWEGSVCDIGTFLNCDASAFSPVAQLAGVPIGIFGAMVGAFLSLGVLFNSPDLARTSRTIALANVAGVVLLFGYSVIVTRTLCLLCAGYYACSCTSLVLLARGRKGESYVAWFLRPSPKHLAAFAVVLLLVGASANRYHQAVRDSQSGGVAARIVRQYYSLPKVPRPSFLSPFWTVRSTERFMSAPIRVVEFGDLLCPDCFLFNRQMQRLKHEFAGKINVAFQFFPLDATCNPQIQTRVHAGACELSFIAAHDPAKFNTIHDEVWANFEAAGSAEWRDELARRHGLEGAQNDPKTRELVRRIIRTGQEYAAVSDALPSGIRSTPTLIVNDRMLIGTFPYEHLRAIFQALIDEHNRGEAEFLENWLDSQNSPRDAYHQP